MDAESAVNGEQSMDGALEPEDIEGETSRDRRGLILVENIGWNS